MMKHCRNAQKITQIAEQCFFFGRQPSLWQGFRFITIGELGQPQMSRWPASVTAPTSLPLPLLQRFSSWPFWNVATGRSFRSIRRRRNALIPGRTDLTATALLLVALSPSHAMPGARQHLELLLRQQSLEAAPALSYGKLWTSRANLHPACSCRWGKRQSKSIRGLGHRNRSALRNEESELSAGGQSHSSPRTSRPLRLAAAVQADAE